MAAEKIPEKAKDEGSATNGALTVPIRKRVVGMPEDTTSLTFREPEGRDIFEHGVPAELIRRPDGSLLFQINPGAMRGMIAALSGTPVELIDRLSGKDWINAANLLAPFFIPDA
jgi:hypothetical protein